MCNLKRSSSLTRSMIFCCGRPGFVATVQRRISLTGSLASHAEKCRHIAKKIWNPSNHQSHSAAESQPKPTTEALRHGENTEKPVAPRRRGDPEKNLISMKNLREQYDFEVPYGT